MNFSLSIIITHYNQSEFTIEAINSINKALSVCNYNVEDVEIIIVDDTSKDYHIKNISNFIKSLNSNIKINLLELKKNLGVFQARKKGAGEATKEYIFFLDGDDLIENNFILNIFKCLEKHNNVDIIRNCIINFNGDSFWQESYYKLKHNHRGFLSNEELLDNPIVTMSNIYRRNYCMKIFDFIKVNLYKFEDAVFYFSCIVYDRPNLIENSDTIIFYRRHQESFLTKINSKKNMERGDYSVFLDSFLINFNFLLSVPLFHNKKILEYFIRDYKIFKPKRVSLLGKVIFLKKQRLLKKALKKITTLSNSL